MDARVLTTSGDSNAPVALDCFMFRRLALAAVPVLLGLGLAVLPSAAGAQDWQFSTLANVSATMGINDGRLCLGEGSRQDIGCPTYAPFVSSAGNVGIGTTNPGLALDVSGSIRSMGYGTAARLMLYQAGYGHFSLENPQGSYDLRIYDYDRSVERLRITSGGDVGIGTASPNAKLDVYGEVSATQFRGDGSLLTGISSQGDRITSGTVSAIASSADSRVNISGSLNLPAQNVAGATANMIRQNGNPFIYTFRPTGNDGGNLFIGVDSGNTTMISTTSSHGASYNTGVGQNTLRNNTTGFYNTASGFNALATNTTGYYNTASGLGALANTSTGFQNTASGVNALYSNTTGAYNTASGVGALFSNTTGTFNTASGLSALTLNTTGSQNTTSGVNALYSNTTGNFNTASGVNALYELTTGSNNTALGLSSGRGITTGSANTILGANVTSLPSDLSNTIILADGDGNQRIRVNAAGNVGIGTTSPNAKLDVSGRVSASVVQLSDDGAGCTTATLGTIRRDPATGKFQICRL